jgi:hypothetical protein
MSENQGPDLRKGGQEPKIYTWIHKEASAGKNGRNSFSQGLALTGRFAEMEKKIL